MIVKGEWNGLWMENSSCFYDSCHTQIHLFMKLCLHPLQEWHQELFHNAPHVCHIFPITASVWVEPRVFLIHAAAADNHMTLASAKQLELEHHVPSLNWSCHIILLFFSKLLSGYCLSTSMIKWERCVFNLNVGLWDWSEWRQGSGGNHNIQTSLPLSSSPLMFLYCPFVYGGSDNRVSLRVEKRPGDEELGATGSTLTHTSQLFDWTRVFLIQSFLFWDFSLEWRTSRIYSFNNTYSCE